MLRDTKLLSRIMRGDVEPLDEELNCTIEGNVIGSRSHWYATPLGLKG